MEADQVRTFDVVWVDSAKSRNVKFSVGREIISWQCTLDGLLKTYSLRYRQILSCTISRSETKNTIDLYYVKVIANKDKTILLRHDRVTFSSDDARQIDDLCAATNVELYKIDRQRPKQWLVLLNPNSGGKTAVHNYKTLVQPLLKVASVTSKHVVTEDRTHAEKYLADCDLSNVDAVVSMGGDGSYGHVLNGFIRKCMIDAKLNMDDPNVAPITPTIGFGVLPAGSGSLLASSANMTTDLETCVLSIILGQKSLTDLSVIRRKDNTILRYCMFVVTYGGFSDAFELLESFRIFKNHRYWFVIPAALYTFATSSVEVSYLPVSDTENEVLYPNTNYVSPIRDHISKPGWKTFSGKLFGFIMTISYLMKFFNWNRKRVYSKPVTSSGKYRIMFEKSESLWQCIKMYISYTRKVATHEDEMHAVIPRESLEIVEGTEIHFRRLDKTSGPLSVYSTGEPLYEDDCKAKIYAKVFPMYVIDDELVSETLKCVQ